METSRRTHDLGSDFELSEFVYDNRLIGYFVTGPAAPNCKNPHRGRCGGLVPITDYHDRPKWESSGEWPNITLTPSVVCSCGGQHCFIRNGKYVKV